MQDIEEHHNLQQDDYGSQNQAPVDPMFLLRYRWSQFKFISGAAIMLLFLPLIVYGTFTDFDHNMPMWLSTALFIIGGSMACVWAKPLGQLCVKDDMKKTSCPNCQTAFTFRAHRVHGNMTSRHVVLDNVLKLERIVDYQDSTACSHCGHTVYGRTGQTRSTHSV
jgi:hypothetical protein